MVFNTYLLLKTKIVDEKKAEKYKSSQFVNFDNLRKRLRVCREISAEAYDSGWIKRISCV